MPCQRMWCMSTGEHISQMSDMQLASKYDRLITCRTIRNMQVG